MAYYLSPSNFNATWGNANGWNLNSTGYLNNGWNVNTSIGARQIPATIENSSMNWKVYGYGFYLEEVIFNILKIVYL